MRKLALLLAVLVLVAGCGKESASPTPSPTSAPEATTVASPVVVTPAGPATCVLESFDFPVNPSIPPVTEVDHVHGPDDASITFIEYADFQ